jgi:hypothetical protein
MTGGLLTMTGTSAVGLSARETNTWHCPDFRKHFFSSESDD